jgi:hypothetical protein
MFIFDATKLFRLAYAKEWEKMRDLIVNGKDPFKGSKSHENSNSGGSGSKTSERTRSFDRTTRDSRLESFGQIDSFDRTDSVGTISSDLSLIRKTNDATTERPEIARNSGKTKPLELEEIKTQEGGMSERPNNLPTETIENSI